MPPVTRSLLANLVVAVAFAMFPPLAAATTAAERVRFASCIMLHVGRWTAVVKASGAKVD